MPTRSRLLQQISELLKVDRYGDIQEFRAAHPEISGLFSRLDRASDLEAVIEYLKSGNLPAPEPPKKVRKRKAIKTPAEMLKLREEGQTLAAIGRLSGVSRQAVNEAIQKERLRQQAP